MTPQIAVLSPSRSKKHDQRLHPGLDTELEGELEDDGQSPPTKKAKKTPGQSRLSRQDHSESRMLHYFEQSDKQYRLDAEAERAHQRDMVSINLI